MPDSLTWHVYMRGDAETFKDDKEAGSHFHQIGSPKQEQAEKREAALKTLEKELKTLAKSGTPDGPTRKRIKEVKEQLALLTKPKEEAPVKTDETVVTVEPKEGD